MKNTPLLLKFRDADTPTGITRETLNRIGEQLGMKPTQVVHLALARMAAQFESADDWGEVTEAQIAYLRQIVGPLPKGERVVTSSILR